MLIRIDPESPTTLRLEFDSPASFDWARWLHDALEAVPGIERVVIGRYLAHVSIARHVADLPKAAAAVAAVLRNHDADPWYDRERLEAYEARVAGAAT